MRYILLSFLFSISLSAAAQYWAPIIPGDSSLFSGNVYMHVGGTGTDPGLQGLVVDSVHYNSSDTLYFPHPGVASSGGFPCSVDPYHGQWIGNLVKCGTAGRQVYYNYLGDSMVIMSQAQVGESWEFYPGDTAIVVDIRLESFLGISDSVKLIKLVDDTARLSKVHGWIDGVSFHDYPDDVWHYELTGYNQSGTRNLTAREIYDFQPGDEVHVEFLDRQMIQPYIRRQYMLKYLSRLDAGDSTTYTVERCGMEELYVAPSFQYTYWHDTVTATYNFTDSTISLLNALSGNTVFYPNGVSVYDQDVKSSFHNRRMKLSWDSTIDQLADSCYTEVIASRYAQPMAYEGLGYGYHGSFADPYYYNRIVYYKKGSETWGTPYSCAGLLSGMGDVLDTDVSIYPNPVSDKLFITGCEGLQGQVFIYDITGRVAYQQGLESIIDVSQFKPGAYVLKVMSTGNVELTNKLIIKQ